MSHVNVLLTFCTDSSGNNCGGGHFLPFQPIRPLISIKIGVIDKLIALLQRNQATGFT